VTQWANALSEPHWVPDWLTTTVAWVQIQVGTWVISWLD